MADLRDIAKAHKTGTIHLSGSANNEAEYNANVTTEDVTKLTWSELQAEMAKVAYIEERKVDYPSYAEQFDLIFHSGLDAWKSKIQETKTKFPKPE
tara:strand:+ start:453 stop:740 length:288 start_codon:yes stop_codon:yes gene_type:complete